MYKDTDGGQETRDKTAEDDSAHVEDTVQISATELAAIRQSASNPEITPEILAEMDRRRGVAQQKQESPRERETTPRQQLPAVDVGGDDDATQTFDRSRINAMLQSGLPPLTSQETPAAQKTPAEPSAADSPLDELGALDALKTTPTKQASTPQPDPDAELADILEAGADDIFQDFEIDPSDAVLEIVELTPDDSAIHSGLFEDLDDEELDAIFGDDFDVFGDAEFAQEDEFESPPGEWSDAPEQAPEHTLTPDFVLELVHEGDQRDPAEAVAEPFEQERQLAESASVDEVEEPVATAPADDLEELPDSAPADEIEEPLDTTPADEPEQAEESALDALDLEPPLLVETQDADASQVDDSKQTIPLSTTSSEETSSQQDSAWTHEELVFRDVERSALTPWLTGLLAVFGIAACAGAALRFVMPTQFGLIPGPLAAAVAVAGLAMVFVAREMLRA